MISVSRKEAEVIDFLSRNSLGKYTMRNIASQVRISPAGVHKILKGLEKEKVLVSERLGTGLFYEIDFSSRVARNLAAFVLSQTAVNYPRELHSLGDSASLLIVHNKSLVAVNVSDDRNIEEMRIKLDMKLMMYTQEEFAAALRKKQEDLLKVVGKGVFVFGEHYFAGMMQNV